MLLMQHLLFAYKSPSNFELDKKQKEPLHYSYHYITLLLP